MVGQKMKNFQILNCLNKRKAQFKIQQMAFMILAVILLFVIALLFYLSIQQKNLINQSLNLRENQAVIMSRFISDSSEFSCGSYCVDTDRMIFLQNRSVYNKFWPVSYIRIRKIYPEYNNEECGIANYPNCSFFNIYENSNIESNVFVGSFVALCRYEKIQDSPERICEIGKITVGYNTN
ncbi:MAG: hypothetical protein KJ559_01900 [Nanoarchaeota archaeon]|nr:hypothetical protein [Nanoarchaeota archaeon]